LTGKAVAAEYLGQMLMRGTENMTRQQISDELDNYRTRMSASGSPGNLSISIQTTRENLVRVMGIMEEVLRRPTFPAEELELIREEQISGIGQQLTEPTAIASNAVQKKISPYSAEDPRFVASMQEELERAKAVTVDQVRDVYNQMVGASVGELTIVGDFDADKVLPVVDRITNGWKSNVAFERLSREAVSNETGTFEQINTPDKANAAYFAALTIPISDDHPDYPALAVGNFILGANGLSSRLGNRIRQKDGLSYTVQSNLQAASGDPRAVFYIFAISNPDNAQKVHLAVQEELDRLLKDGITAEELEDARKGYLQQQEVRRTSDRSLASMLESLSFYDRDLSFVGDFESKVAALTVEDVNSALRKHIQPQRLYTVSAGDFAKGPAAADAPAAGN
ncbi:MAG: insulinase family protein, partial [Planctomycetaceae bacterium]|nr:insulinase family protein [Planctomycetaceae bacterium]